jgi:hypothetical protein
VYTRGIQDINIQHQEVGGTYQVTDAGHVRFNVRWFGRPENTNDVPGAGDHVWQVSVTRHTLTTTTDGVHSRDWERE